MVGALGETMPYFPPCVALEDQACGSQTPEMLTGCTKFYLQFLRDLAEAELRMCCEQFEDFNTPVIRETTDDLLEPLRPRPGTTDDTLGRLHQPRRLLPPAIPRQQHSNVPRNVGMFYPTPHLHFSLRCHVRNLFAAGVAPLSSAHPVPSSMPGTPERNVRQVRRRATRARRLVPR